MVVLDRSYALSLLRKKRRQAETLKSRYKALIATPQTLLGGAAPAVSAALPLPANARLAVSSDAPVAAGAVVVNVAGGRTLGTPALAAGELHELGYIESGREVTLETTIAGAATVSLHFLDEWKRPSVIASSVFT